MIYKGTEKTVKSLEEAGYFIGTTQGGFTYKS